MSSIFDEAAFARGRERYGTIQNALTYKGYTIDKFGGGYKIISKDRGEFCGMGPSGWTFQSEKEAKSKIDVYGENNGEHF